MKFDPGVPMGIFTVPTRSPTMEDIMKAVEDGRRIMSVYPDADELADMLAPKYHFVRGGRSLFIPTTVPLIPDPSMTETVRVEEDGDRFTEYGEEDEGWRRYFGFVRDETRPAMFVRILDITCPVTGKRTRGVYAHPDTIALIRQTGGFVPRTFMHGVCV